MCMFDCLSFFLIRILELQHALLPPKCYEPRSVPQLLILSLSSPQTHIWIYQGSWEHVSYIEYFINSHSFRCFTFFLDPFKWRCVMMIRMVHWWPFYMLCIVYILVQHPWSWCCGIWHATWAPSIPFSRTSYYYPISYQIMHVHINISRMLKCVYSLNAVASRTWTPTSHNNFNSSINGSRYVSNCAPITRCGSGMMSDNITKCFYWSTKGVCWLTRLAILTRLNIFSANGFTWLVTKPNRIFLTSLKNVGQWAYMNFHCLEYVACLTTHLDFGFSNATPSILHVQMCYTFVPYKVLGENDVTPFKQPWTSQLACTLALHTWYIDLCSHVHLEITYICSHKH